LKILILGIGNILFADEGVGVHIVNLLKKKYSFEGEHEIELMDGGTLAQHLIPIIVEYDYLILVDTINAPKAQIGDVYFFDFDDIPSDVDWQGSAHEVEMLQTLTMMDLVGDRPTTKIFGIVPTVIEPIEFSLTDAVRNAVDIVEKTLIEHLESLSVKTSIKEQITIDEILPNSFKMNYDHTV